jgi:hypothetical protein
MALSALVQESRRLGCMLRSLQVTYLEGLPLNLADAAAYTWCQKG